MYFQVFLQTSRTRCHGVSEPNTRLRLWNVIFRLESISVDCQLEGGGAGWKDWKHIHAFTTEPHLLSFSQPLNII